jgi:hypothetical protein
MDTKVFKQTSNYEFNRQELLKTSSEINITCSPDNLIFIETNTIIKNYLLI